MITTTGWIPTIEGWSLRAIDSDGGWNLRTPQGVIIEDADGDARAFPTIGDLIGFVRQIKSEAV